MDMEGWVLPKRKRKIKANTNATVKENNLHHKSFKLQTLTHELFGETGKNGSPWPNWVTLL